MSFSFNFSGDDIDGDSDEEMKDAAVPSNTSTALNVPEDHRHSRNISIARREIVTELLSSLPSRISYTCSLITSPKQGRQMVLPRRALFDVKIQIMAESDEDDDEGTISANAHQAAEQSKAEQNRSIPTNKRDIGLGNSDIEQDVYEGGFKTWEGAMDLAQLLLDKLIQDNHANYEQILELGCGTAIPSLVLFQQALSAGVPLNLTLADYNESVLRLVTLPNLILNWALRNSPESFSPRPPSSATSETPLGVRDADGDLEITSELIDAFNSDLERRHITITLVSGPWAVTEQYTSLLSLSPQTSLLVLAAETIYSPSALRSFTSTLIAILRSVERSTALVAAKRMYFGVGGGVEEFKSYVEESGAVVEDVEGTGIQGCDRTLLKGNEGVGRWIGEVKLKMK